MTNVSAKTIHDEYWHPHIDKVCKFNIILSKILLKFISEFKFLTQETYKSFHYTTLLYLNDFGRDFEGGRFVFIDKNNVKTIIEPRKGKQ